MTEAEALLAIQKTVSRETLRDFERYLDLLATWQKRLNLVSPASLTQAWSRHFLDSVQLFDLVTLRKGTWLDMGSGGGFPGLVCAIMARDRGAELDFILVESDKRKAVFLQTVSRELNLPTDIRAKRIETLAAVKAQVISARALAPLDTLCQYAASHISAEGVCLFLKGVTHRNELSVAQKRWQMSVELIPSRSDSSGAIVKIEGLRDGSK